MKGTMTCALVAALGLGAFAQVRIDPPETAKSAAERVKADFPSVPASGICRYAVPALGETQYLPDTYPHDGRPNAPCTIVAAKDEYEPGSFLLYATKDLGKVQFEVCDLKQVKKAGKGEEKETGVVFPKEKLDLKTVKVWYQNGNGWYSYFQDVGLKLCPELLLNDEDLVKVDTEKVANYARLTGKDGKVSYFWLTAPRGIYARTPDFHYYYSPDAFLSMKENFKDAPTFQGATLKKGEFKQFLLTAHVTKDVPAGLYRGAVALKKDGRKIDEVPVALRVHDFVLPKPKTYFDLDRDFVTWFCEYLSIQHITVINGGDEKLAEKQLFEILKDYARHGHVTPCFRDTVKYRALAEKAGLDYTHGHGCSMKPGDMADMRANVRAAVRGLDKEFGRHEGLMASWGDEYGLATLRSIRDMVKLYQEAGFVFSVNSRYGYSAGANVADIWWPPVKPDQESAPLAEKYNFAHGGWMGWYADQHVGPENPAFNRRQYGFGPYRAGFGCSYNYAHHLDGWNDINPTLYKPMMLIYGAGHGCIDTLAWEGFREGLDDIRYATLLQQLARPLVESKNIDARYAAKLALKLLADANGDDEDLTTLRLEMIEHIERLRALNESVK